MKEILEKLYHPSEEAKGWTRWWWFGPSVTKEEISRELREIRNAGMGGVELQVLYPLTSDDPEKGRENYSYFSPGFFEMLRFTCEEAERLGLGVDFTLGSSWPYGGPFIPDDMAAEYVVPYQIDVHGPLTNFCYDFTTRIAGQIPRAVMGRMKEGRMEPETVREITGSVRDKMLYGWPWGLELSGLDIPEGDWKLVFFVSLSSRLQVGKPARGMRGNAMDHCRRDVMERFLRNNADPLIQKLGEGRLSCIFCDSIELDGNNWTRDLPEEFEKRRGYRLEPWLYALWGELGDVSDRVRYDYFETMSELTLENFFDGLTLWCHEHGMKSRIQAHGTWADMLKAYAAADIPEGETFGPQDKFEVNSIQRRFASSAAHFYGRPVVSNESFTWLRVPRFMETLENIKAAADAVFLDGMNAVYNHGYAYSPEEEGAPGWPFYASSQINHTNPYWCCYPEAGAYIQRVSELLRQGRFVSRAAVYLPQADVWSENPMSSIHLGMKLQEYLGWGVPDALSKAGYYFDYVNDEVLNRFAVYENGFRVQGNTTRVLILIDTKRLPVETALSLEKFVKSGGILIAAERVPDRSCGLLNHEERDKAVREIMCRLFPEKPGMWKKTGLGTAGFSENRREALLLMLSEKDRPDLKITGGEDATGYIHRTFENGELYFIANISEKSRSVLLDFSVSVPLRRLIDPLTLKKLNWEKREQAYQVNLEPFQSVFAFLSEDLPEEKGKDPGPVSDKTVLAGPWRLEIPEKNFSKTLESPVCWESFTELKYYSGKGSYSTFFSLEKQNGKQYFLDFEGLYDSAEIFLNGEKCAVLWKRPWRTEVTGFLKNGENHLLVRVGNRLINKVIDPEWKTPYEEKSLLDGWPYFSDIMNQFWAERLCYEKEKESVKEPVPSGLSGRVYLSVY